MVRRPPLTAVEIARQIDHWIDDNPYYSGIHWISALEAGTRVISWILAYPFFGPVADEHFRQKPADLVGAASTVRRTASCLRAPLRTRISSGKRRHW